MGRGFAATLLLALLASSAAASAAPKLAALDDPLLGASPDASAASAKASALPAATPASGALPADAPRDVLASIAGALGAVAQGLAGAAGGVLAAGGALLGGLGALAGAVLAAVGAALGSLAGALGAGLQAGARHPALPASAAIGSAFAAASSALQPRALLAPLFSRLEKHELLRHDARQRIFEFVRARPGAHLSLIHGHIGLGWGATVYHLRRMREAQLLTARTVGNQLCHFVNGDSHTHEEQQLLAATKTLKAQAIVDFLKLRGPSAQHRLAQELGMSSALVSWHAKRLEELGVVERVRAGRTRVLALRAAPAPAATVRAVPAAVPAAMPAPARAAPSAAALTA